jgi:hypothetical protein
MSRLDPKPGRWILPLAVAGIVGFTWVFVNALPPAEEVAADDSTTTTTEAPATDGTTTTLLVPDATTTTTTPPEIAEFLLAADTVATAADDLLTEAQDINETWEDGRNFTLALNSLRDFATKTSDFADGVADTNVPEGLTELWDPVRSAAASMLSSADEMVTGLQASDTGQIRRAALGDFTTAVGELSAAVTTATQAAS